MKTTTLFLKKNDIRPSWYIVDAKGQTLGRLVTQVARVLLGKHDPRFTPGVNLEHYVIVVNADKFIVSGKKLNQKVYYRHSGYPGNLKSQRLADKLAQKPEDALRLAVKGMLPHNVHGRKLLEHLKVYAGDQHDHQAQQPVVLAI